MRTQKLPCGCKFTDEPARWVEECPAHKSTTAATRARWKSEREISQQLVAGDTPAGVTT